MDDLVVYVGLPKAGSTWLYRNLARHSDICVPHSKETFFFDRYHDRGRQWFEAQFDRPDAMCLDTSHDYIFDPAALARIKSLYPHARIIAFLRDPVDWLASMIKSAERAGWAQGSLGRTHILHMHQLARFSEPLEWIASLGFASFDAYLFEDLRDDPVGLLGRIATDLGLAADDDWLADAATRVNERRAARSPALARLTKRGSHLARERGWNRALQTIKDSAVVERLVTTDAAESVEPVFDPETVEVLRSYYANDVRAVADLLHRPELVSTWSCG